MANYRPICDMWILARPKVAYYGAYPNGFLERARPLIGAHIDEPVLHVCAGKVRDYPGWGFGPNDVTLDLSPECNPDFLQDAREPFPKIYEDDPTDTYYYQGCQPPVKPFDGILIDRPYTPEDADHYPPSRETLPTAAELVRNGLEVLSPGKCVGILDYEWARPPNYVDHKLIATVGVLMGYGNRIRVFTVFQKR